METPLNSRSDVHPLSLAGVPLSRILVAAGVLASAFVMGFVVKEQPLVSVLLSVALAGTFVLLAVRFMNLAHVMGIALMAGIAIAARDFARIPIVPRPVPLYPVDFTMLVLAASFGLEALRRGRIPQIPMFGLTLIWIVYGLIALVRSFFLYDDSVLLESHIPTSRIEVEIVRDSVMVFYATFTIFFAVLARDERFLRRFFAAMIFSGILTTTAALSRIAGMDWNVIPFFSLIYPALIAIVAWTLAPHLSRRVQWLIYTMTAILLFETAINGDISRALLVGLIAAFFYLSFIGTPRMPALQIRRLVVFGTMGLIIALVIGIAYIVQPEMLLRAGTAGFRLATWRLTFLDALEHPIFGWAFGNPMVTRTMFATTGHYAPTNDPHNTWLSLFYRLGLVGCLLFAWLNYAFFVRCIRVIRNTPSPFLRDVVRAISGIQVFIFVFGVFNPLLESPHYALWYWVILGIGLTIATAELERIVARAPTEPLPNDSSRVWDSHAS